MMQGLTVKEMEELHDDIKMHLDMDRKTQTHIDFWEVLFFSFLYSCCGCEREPYLWKMPFLQLLKHLHEFSTLHTCDGSIIE